MSFLEKCRGSQGSKACSSSWDCRNTLSVAISCNSGLSVSTGGLKWSWMPTSKTQGTNHMDDITLVPTCQLFKPQALLEMSYVPNVQEIWPQHPDWCTIIWSAQVYIFIGQNCGSCYLAPLARFIAITEFQHVRMSAFAEKPRRSIWIPAARSRFALARAWLATHLIDYPN